MQTASITSFTPAGGFFMALTSVMSALVSVSSAARASLSMGTATASSASQSSLIAFADSALSAANASSFATTARTAFADSVSRPTVTRISSVSTCVLCKTGPSSISSTFMVSTWDSALKICAKPLSYRSRSVDTARRFSANSVLYVPINSRYEVGVTYMCRPWFARNFSESARTLVWNTMHMSMHEVLSLLPIWTSLKNCVATLFSASTGHSLNQSIVQQFTRDGNFRNRVLNASPTGEKHNTVCRFRRHSFTKNLNFSADGAFSSTPAFFARTVTKSAICATSSLAKRLGTSPVFKTLFMSSRKLSNLICVSEKRNTVGFPSPPAFRKTVFKSSRHSRRP
mmetsp:Transcript_7047/g.26633  ORF Transcript_7047/g.26633 Transcript_7047/m.26633 type:complete len:341 (-) Transcript_7047:3498-4520(-)